MIESKDVENGVVNVGVTVHVKDQKSGDSRKFTLVGAAEAQPSRTSSPTSRPLGKALVGHKRGDVVTVEVPRGPKRKLKITKIES